MDVRDALTQAPPERALVEDLVRPRTALERLYGARFSATLEREVPGALGTDIAPIARRIADSFAVDEAGGDANVELLADLPDRVEWRVMAAGTTRYGARRPVQPTRSRIVLHRGPASTRVEMIVALGSPWMLALAPFAALIVFAIAQSLLYLVVGVIVGVVAQWVVRGINAGAARGRVRSAVRSLPTICDAVADASGRRA